MPSEGLAHHSLNERSTTAEDMTSTPAMARSTAGEWRQGFMLPIVAAAGYATSVIHVIGFGPYLLPIGETFGWSRAQVTSGITIANLVAALCGIPIGLLVDRLGPRRLGVIGVMLMCGAFAFLGTATGSRANWYALWGLLAVAAVFVQPSIWTSAVVSRFKASRGLALGITFCGGAFGAAVFPLLATVLIGALGWQQALIAQGAIWAAVTVPLVFLFFRGAQDGKLERTATPSGAVSFDKAALLRALRSSIYLRLALVSCVFAFSIMSLVVHFVPILSAKGVTPLDAAGFASIIGSCSIVARIGTGILLDRYRASLVGAAVVLLPAFASMLLMSGDTSFFHLAGAAVLIGLSLGAEMDVIVFLSTQYFGLDSFGGLVGGLVTAMTVATAAGPLCAAIVYDHYGTYTPLLWVTLLCMAASSASLASLPRPVRS